MQIRKQGADGSLGEFVTDGVCKVNRLGGKRQATWADLRCPVSRAKSVYRSLSTDKGLLEGKSHARKYAHLLNRFEIAIAVQKCESAIDRQLSNAAIDTAADS